MSKDIELYDLYTDSPFEFNKSVEAQKNLPIPHVDAKFIRESIVPTRHCISAKAMRKIKHGKDNDTTGKLWFDMPAKEMTEEIKLDLLALQYGREIHPCNFYKQQEQTGLPRYFQIGRMVEKRGNLDSTCSNSRKNPLKTYLQQMKEDERLHKHMRKRYHEHKQRDMKKKEALRIRSKGRRHK